MRKESCPNCGGTALDPGKSYQCFDCGATFWPNELVVEDDNPPPRPLPRKPPVTAPTALVCPRCEVELHEAHAAEILLRGCGGCGGVWLDGEASKKLFDGIRRDALTLVARADRVRPPDDGGGATKRRCPIDRLPLARTVECGVDVDTCWLHGTFFDAGEIQLIAAAYERDRRIARTHDDPAPALLGAVFRTMAQRG